MLHAAAGAAGAAALRARRRFRLRVHISQEQLGVFVGAARRERQSPAFKPGARRRSWISRAVASCWNMTKLTAIARNE